MDRKVKYTIVIAILGIAFCSILIMPPALAVEESMETEESNSHGDFVNINMLGRWIYDGETTGLSGLFDGEPFQLNYLLTISTLKIQMEQETHTVTAYFAYKIKGEVAAEAILPFNIES
jgi:hypothetical protein